LLVPSGDSDALSEKIHYLVMDTEKQKEEVEKSISLSKDKYNLVQCAEIHFKAFESVL
jgi:hypothetical protein